MTTPIPVSARLPEENVEHEARLEHLPIGESGWTVPWAMNSYGPNGCYLNLGFMYDNTPGGTSQMLVRRDADGYRVTIRQQDRYHQHDGVPHFDNVPVLEVGKFPETSKQMVGLEPLTFDNLRKANEERCEAPRPRGFHHQIDTWTPLQWAGAMCGEAGEAANKCKKIDRQMLYGDEFSKDLQHGEIIDPIAAGREIGDTIIYADLLARRLGLSLEEMVRIAFNDKSDEIGSDIKL